MESGGVNLATSRRRGKYIDGWRGTWCVQGEDWSGTIPPFCPIRRKQNPRHDATVLFLYDATGLPPDLRHRSASGTIQPACYCEGGVVLQREEKKKSARGRPALARCHRSATIRRNQKPFCFWRDSTGLLSRQRITPSNIRNDVKLQDKTMGEEALK